MTRKQRKHRIAGGIAAVAVVAAAAGALGIAQLASPADASGASATAPGHTVVTFTDTAVGALAPLHLSGSAPGVFGLSPNGFAAQADFPVVSAAGGVLTHDGGLTLSKGTSIVTLRNYVIDTRSGVLTADGFLDGSALGRIDFLAVTPTPTAAGCLTSAKLALTADAAKVLSYEFGAPDLTNAPIGTACVKAGRI